MINVAQNGIFRLELECPKCHDNVFSVVMGRDVVCYKCNFKIPPEKLKGRQLIIRTIIEEISIEIISHFHVLLNK
jgi:hypothetical protein